MRDRDSWTHSITGEDKDEGTETAVHTPHQERTKMREQRQLDTHHTRSEDKDEGTETAGHTPHQERGQR